jgi:hypothetical protein
MGIKIIAMAVLMLLAMPGASAAQEETQPSVPDAKQQPVPDAKVFRLDFVVKEIEGGRVINSRGYSTSISTGAQARAASVRTGSKVPLAVSTTQFQYQDVGVNIDAQGAREVQGHLSLNVSAEVSSVVTEAPASEGAPVIRQARWGASVLVPLKKAAVIFSSDDPTMKRQTQLELTATPIP